MTVEERLTELGIHLPSLRPPSGNFVSWRRAGTVLYLSGQGARADTGQLSVGRLGLDCTVEQGYADARRIGLQMLATIKDAVGSLDHIDDVVKLFGMVNAQPTFTEHPRVINGCSDLLVEVFGDRGRHARSAVGMGSLPGGMTVEIEAILTVKAGY